MSSHQIVYSCPVCTRYNSVSVDGRLRKLLCAFCATPMQVPLSHCEPGVVLDDFHLLEELGHGGMGTVYKARQNSLDRIVAVKVIQQSEQEEQLLAFLNEARMAARLNHANIVHVYAVGQAGPVWYFAMEMVHGPTCAELLMKRRFKEHEALGIAIKVAQALDYGWRKERLVHMDVKPDNIMIDADGVVKLMDLGLSSGLRSLVAHSSDQIKGTLHYIAPEQFLGHEVDCRADMYSLGCTLCEMLTGRYLFEFTTADEALLLHTQAEPPLGEAPISATLKALLMRLLAKDPGERPSSHEEVAGLLRECLDEIEAEAQATVFSVSPAPLARPPPIEASAAPGRRAARPPPIEASAAPGRRAARPPPRMLANPPSIAPGRSFAGLRSAQWLWLWLAAVLGAGVLGFVLGRLA